VPDRAAVRLRRRSHAVSVGVTPGSREGHTSTPKEWSMSNRGEDLKGRAKEAAGSLTDDDDLRREGKTDQASAKVKDKAEDVVDAVKDKVDHVLHRD
jgi:uncharacterized protein YjbJ (UPF0337 family)